MSILVLRKRNDCHTLSVRVLRCLFIYITNTCCSGLQRALWGRTDIFGLSSSTCGCAIVGAAAIELALSLTNLRYAPLLLSQVGFVGRPRRPQSTFPSSIHSDGSSRSPAPSCSLPHQARSRGVPRHRRDDA